MHLHTKFIEVSAAAERYNQTELCTVPQGRHGHHHKTAYLTSFAGFSCSKLGEHNRWTS